VTLSLRARVLLGAILWTIGLVVLSFVIIAAVFHFAGHGALRAGDPWSAHLRLARGETLGVEDVLVARPRVGLVVLNGCATATAEPALDPPGVRVRVES